MLSTPPRCLSRSQVVRARHFLCCLAEHPDAPAPDCSLPTTLLQHNCSGIKKWNRSRISEQLSSSASILSRTQTAHCTQPAMSSVSGEASRRPVPTRTLPQPASLSVAQRDDGVTVTGRAKSDVQALKDDLTRRAELTRKAERWMDRLMEDTPSPATVKKAVSWSPSGHRLSLLV